MEFLGWIKPQVNPLFSVAFTPCENVGLKNRGLPGSVSQELEVDFVVLGVLGRELQARKSNFQMRKIECNVGVRVDLDLELVT